MPDSRPHRPQDPDDVVRHLLADARHDDPVPDDVAQRLDRVLDGLREESAGAGSTTSGGSTGGAGEPRDPGASGGAAPVADLDDRRHRRRIVTQLLLGAAAVLIVGIGIARTVGGDSDSPPDTASSVQRQSAGDSSGDSSGDQAAGGGPSAAGSSGYAQLEPRLPVPLRSDALDRSARSALAIVAQLPPSLQSARPLALALGEPPAGWSCGTGTSTRAYGTGVLLPATYDGTAVVLAVRPARGDGEPARVEVLACGSGHLVRATTVDPT